MLSRRVCNRASRNSNLAAHTATPSAGALMDASSSWQVRTKTQGGIRNKLLLYTVGSSRFLACLDTRDAFSNKYMFGHLGNDRGN